MKKEWYVLQIYSGMENKVKELIEEKAKMTGQSQYFGKIVVPELEEIDYSNKKSEKIIVDFDTKILVKKGKDVKKGTLLAKEPDIFIKNSGEIVESKNYRKFVIETKGKKYIKSFLIPESANVLSGIRQGKQLKPGTPFTTDSSYECDVDGVVSYVEKAKRIVVQPDNVEEKDVYIVPRNSLDTKLYKNGSLVKKDEKISIGNEFKARTNGRIDIKQHPMTKEIRVIKTSKKKLFPGYIFIEMMYIKEAERLVISVPYVSTFLNMGGKPLKLRRNEVRAILRLMGEEVFEEKRNQNIKIDYKINEHVKIISGPFEYFTGKIKKIDPDKAEVVVVVSMFGRETEVELSLSEIEEITD